MSSAVFSISIHLRLSTLSPKDHMTKPCALHANPTTPHFLLVPRSLPPSPSAPRFTPLSLPFSFSSATSPSSSPSNSPSSNEDLTPAGVVTLRNADGRAGNELDTDLVPAVGVLRDGRAGKLEVEGGRMLPAPAGGDEELVGSDCEGAKGRAVALSFVGLGEMDGAVSTSTSTSTSIGSSSGGRVAWGSIGSLRARHSSTSRDIWAKVSIRAWVVAR